MIKVHIWIPTFKGINKNLGVFYLIHNGNINFGKSIREKYPNLNDTKILVKIIEDINKNNWFDIFEEIIRDIPGVYNVIVSTNKIFCFKDRFNVRPLCLGKNKSGFCVASES